MISRRSFLGYSAATLGTPLLARLGGLSGARTPDTFKVKFTNNSGAGNAYAYVTGTTVADNRLVLVKADGTSLYYPDSPGAPSTPIAEDCAITLDKTITIPKIYGARIYVVMDDKLDFFLNPGPALVQPSMDNSADSNYNKNWTFAEFTFNDTQLFANISYVDFVAAPLGLHLQAGSGDQTVNGLPAKSLGSIASDLSAAGGAWAGLVVNGGDGQPLRAIAPGHKIDAFNGYMEPYVDQVWQKYTGTDLNIDAQNGNKYTGRVNGDQFVFGSESFAKPSTGDIWSCNSGPFDTNGASPERLAIIPRIAAALNRSTLLDNPNQPDGEDPAKFYQTDPTNHYAKIVHAHLPDNRGYAFPYDDVTPGQDFSGAVQAGDPDTLTITVNALR